MRILLSLPIVVAALAAVCAVWPAARRLLVPVSVLAAINVVLTPLTSGEWFYQRAEDSAYQDAVARGDFTGFDNLLERHDPHLLSRMIGIAVALLVVLVVMAALRFRADRGARVSRAAWAVAAVAVLVAALATAGQVYLLVS